jgi:hypothetical protein
VKSDQATCDEQIAYMGDPERRGLSLAMIRHYLQTSPLAGEHELPI